MTNQHPQAQDCVAELQRLLDLSEVITDADTDATFIPVPIEEFLAITRAAIAAIKAQQWQPIETAPKDGTRIVGATPYGSEVVKWCDGSMFTQFGPGEGWIGTEQDSTCLPQNYRRGSGQHQPTHWQPLPAAPGAPR